MLQYRLPLAQVLAGVIVVICFVIALIMVAAQSAGRARVFGVAGVAMLFGSPIADSVNRSIGSVYGTHTLAYAVGTMIVAGLSAVGIVLVAVAVISALKARRLRGERR